MDYLWKIFEQSELAQGGLIVIVGGSIMGILYKLLFTIRNFVNRISTVEITASESHGNSFEYLVYWLKNQQYTDGFCSKFLAMSSQGNIILSPSYGSHLFFYRRRPAWLIYKVEEEGHNRVENINIIFFRVFGKKALITEVIEEGRKLYYSEKYTGTKIYIQRHDYWEMLLTKETIASPVLANKDDYSNVLEDMNKFLVSKQDYLGKGINYKRGYLFYGPPGNGKTTCILSLAQDLQKHLCVINLGDIGLSEKALLMTMGQIPKDSIVCFEDIDAIHSRNIKKDKIKSREEYEKEDSSPVSLSTILNVLDGIFTPNGLIFIMTTNYKETLDTALIRPGRIDYQYEFKNTNEYQLDILASRFDKNPKDYQNLLDKPVSESSLNLNC